MSSPRPTLALLAAALLGAGCGTTLVDSDGSNLISSLCTCTAPSGASPVCNPDGSCDYVCSGDLLKCGGGCIPCTPPANASAACAPGGVCGFTCNAPTRLCPGATSTCQAESETSCGPTCATCPGPVTGPGRPICQTGTSTGQGTCGLACDAGNHACGASCYADADPLHCGPSCQTCTAPANGSPLCSGGACAFACNPGYLRCGSGCCRADAVAGGGEFGCALLDDGRVRCWGANDRGQLGNGTTVASSVPVDVAGLPASPSRAVAVATGWAHACAAVSSGDVWCWGDNSTGELGPGATAAFSTTPVRVTGVTGVAAPATRASPPTLAAGGGTSTTAPTVFGHSCAVGSGGLACWGANDSGQLGNGTTTQSATPVAIGLPTVTSIAAGQRHTCAVSAGALRCWGANGSGQVGDGTSSQRTTPTAVSTTSFPSGSTATFVATSRASTCAVVTGTAPQLFCWGENGSGQVTASAPPPATQLTPIAPSLGGGFQPLWVSAGRAHVCGLEPGTNGLKCFGANGLSQLSGAPTAIGKNDVVLGAAGGLATTVAAGGDHSCALLVDGSIQCWGANDRGQTGTGLPDATLTTPTFLSGR